MVESSAHVTGKYWCGLLTPCTALCFPLVHFAVVERLCADPVLIPLWAPTVSSLAFHVANELTVLYQHPGLMHDKEAQAAKPIEDRHSD